VIRILFQHPGGSYRTKLHINVPQDLLEDAYRTGRETALRVLSGSQPRYLKDFTEADSGSLARHS
jgi:hypothetical protein